jgi:putative sigma-54 modulation protein
LPRGMVRVEQAETDMYAAIDLAVERLEQSLKRYKERRLERHHAPEPSLSQEPEPQEEGQIVRVKRFPLRPMNPEDAAFEMEALGHDFYVFRNAKTEQINVIYRRRDGNYGLIEPE